MTNISKLLLILLLIINLVFSQNVNDTSLMDDDKNEVLSRRKRFIVFPEGSSLQLVFCNTYPTIFTIGDIFLWGVTAALAWELPQDPYSLFDHKADPLHRRMDSKMVYYTDENGKVLFKKPYSKKKLIVNPAFAKRSVDGSIHTQQIEKAKEEFKIYRKQMHASENRLEFSKRDERSVEFHRSSRISLYQKIEAMLQGLGGNGRECMLKTLCVVGRTRNDPQGSFLQEILRATFTLPQGYSKNDLEEYDSAFQATKPCEELYPECNKRLTGPNLDF